MGSICVMYSTSYLKKTRNNHENCEQYLKTRQISPEYQESLLLPNQAKVENVQEIAAVFMKEHAANVGKPSLAKIGNFFTNETLPFAMQSIVNIIN